MFTRTVEYTISFASLALLAWIISFGSAFGADVPKLTSYVNDYANVMNAYDRSALNKRLEDFNRTATGHPQVVILILPSLNGADLDSFTNDVFHQNQIGQKNNSNGILTVLAMKEHRSRMEVGYDLEPTITDTTSKKILDGMIPDLRSGNVYKALNDETSQLFPLVSKGSAETQELHGPVVSNNNHAKSSGISGMSLIILLLILGALGYAIYRLFRAVSDKNGSYLSSSNTKSNDSGLSSYRPSNYRDDYTPPSYNPPTYNTPTYNPPSYTPPAPSETGSTVKSAVAGGLAGAAASELLESTRRRRDDDSSSSSSSSSWGYGSSSSDSGSSSSSSDSGSSWSSGSSDSGFSGGGGDSGGGGADSSW